MGWIERVLGSLCLPKNHSSAADRPVDPAAASSSEAAATIVDMPPELPLRELNKATGSFSGARLVGQGRYAKVYRASLRSGRVVAAKRLGKPPSDCWKASSVAFLGQQVSVASRLRHENLVRLLGYSFAGDLRVLLYEFAAVGTLHDVLHGPRGQEEAPPQRWAAGAGDSRPAVRLSWAQRVRIALDAARGLEYLHGAAVTHKEIRSTNVLLFDNLRAKIADYNMFKQLPSDDVEPNHMHIRTSASDGYEALEYMCLGHMTDKSDVFSFGVVLLELLTGRKPRGPDPRTLKSWAAPLLTEGRIEECIDPKLGSNPGAVKKR